MTEWSNHLDFAKDAAADAHDHPIHAGIDDQNAVQNGQDHKATEYLNDLQSTVDWLLLFGFWKFGPNTPGWAY